MFVELAGIQVRMKPLWRGFVLSMITGSLYQAWWLYGLAADLGALARGRAVAPLERCLWPLLIMGSQAGVLWLMMTGASMGSSRWIAAGVCVVVAYVAVRQVAGQIADAERAVGIRRGEAEHALPMFAMLVGICVGGSQALPNGEGEIDLIALLMGGVIPPLWMLVVQYRVNRVLERKELTSDLARNWNYGQYDAISVAVRKRIVAHGRRQEADAQLDLVPWVTIGVAAVCSVAFAWQLAKFGISFDESDVRDSGAMSLELVRAGEAWRLITMHIMHGSIGHWAGNMFALSLTGWMVERTIGHRGMVAVVAAGAAMTTVFDWFGTELLYGPRGAEVLGLGESGIGFAVIGALWGLDRSCHTPVGKFGRALTIIGGVSSLAPGVGILAHAGGFTGGFAIAWLIASQQGLDFAPKVQPISSIIADVQRKLADQAAGASTTRVANVPPSIAQPVLPAVVPPPAIAPPPVVTPPPVIAPPPVVAPSRMQQPAPIDLPAVFDPREAA